MPTLPLTLATRDYDFVTPLATGDVTADGLHLTLRRSFAQARLMGPDFEPYGLGPENRRMIARFCEEQHTQGLIVRPIDPESVFAEFRALAGPAA